MAAAPDDSSVVQMESYLTCSICLGTLQDPRTLRCFHSFCKPCLERFVKIQREKAEVGEVIEVFNCPECRTEFELKDGQQVTGMARNHFIGNMLEMLEIQRRPNQTPCNSCERNTPAVSRCIECRHYLCSECLTAHEKWPALKKHTVFTMEELVNPENQKKTREKSTCEKHKNETLEYYCQTCKKLACIHCVLLEHKEGHSYLSTEEVAEKKRELLKSSSTFLNKQFKEGTDALKHIEHVLQELKKNADKAKDQISKHSENILKAFTERQKSNSKAFTERQKSDLKAFIEKQNSDLKALEEKQKSHLKAFEEKLEEKTKLNTSEVDNTYKIAHELLRNQKADMKVYVEKVKSSTELSNNLLGKGTREEIISFQNEIEENVEKVKNERPTRMKPACHGNIQYNANPVKNIDTISNLNNMGVVVPATNKLCSTSTILNGHIEYVLQVVEWLGDQFQWRLCHRASANGWSTENFHTKCDKKGPTVTLVKVGEYIFGGYTDQNWAAGCSLHQTNVSFLFSLKNKDNLPPFKAPHKRNPRGLSWYFRISCFCFGHDLVISNNSHANQESYSDFGDTYQPPAGYVYGAEQTRSLLAGNLYFTPTEIEVFH